MLDWDGLGCIIVHHFPAVMGALYNMISSSSLGRIQMLVLIDLVFSFVLRDCFFFP